MSAVNSTTEVTALLELWKENFNSSEETPLTTLLTKTVKYKDASVGLIDILSRLADIVEQETEAWYKMDPDPFDDRHPGRVDPNCALGHVMSVMFKNDPFMGKIVGSYITGRDPAHHDLHVMTSRLFIDIIPGLETTVIFSNNDDEDGLIKILIHRCQNASEPLSSYSTGLLACAMEIKDVPNAFKQQNTVLVPLMLRRLQSLKEEMEKESLASAKSATQMGKRYFKDVGKDTDSKKNDDSTSKPKPATSSAPKNSLTEREPITSTPGPSSSLHMPKPTSNHTPRTPLNARDAIASTPVQSSSSLVGQVASSTGRSKVKRKRQTNDNSDGDDEATPLADGQAGGNRRRSKKFRTSSPILGGNVDENQQLPVVVERKKSNYNKVANFLAAAVHEGDSNSCWAELELLVIGKFCMWPLSIEMKQRLILQYLQPMGYYQDLLNHVFEVPIIDMLMFYIDLKQNKDVRLAFEALKYLAALLCHTKFVEKFITASGMQLLLNVPRPSVAATGVSMCLYNLAYNTNSLERVCQLPESVLHNMVSYTLWLLECSHESSRVHAASFFGLAFLYRINVELFDAQDGLRKLFNVMSTLPILNVEEDHSELSEDGLIFNRQSAQLVTIAIRRYLEAHLAYKTDLERLKLKIRTDGIELPPKKIDKYNPEKVMENMQLWLGHETCKPMHSWRPVVNLLKLGAFQTLLNLLNISMNWPNTSTRSDMQKSTLDILAISSFVPAVQNLLCKEVRPADSVAVPALRVILSMASGKNSEGAEVQKAALNVIINLVCRPHPKEKPTGRAQVDTRGGANTEDNLEKIWHSVRSNDGILILLDLLTIKLPVSEADSIRMLACKALVGLSRCSTNNQILSTLPLFDKGQLQQLMWDPINESTRGEHEKFCDYATQLIEQVKGMTPEMRRAAIAAQTKIDFDEGELMTIVQQYLTRKGLTTTGMGHGAAATAGNQLQQGNKILIEKTDLLQLLGGVFQLGGMTESASRLRQLEARSTGSCTSADVDRKKLMNVARECLINLGMTEVAADVEREANLQVKSAGSFAATNTALTPRTVRTVASVLTPPLSTPITPIRMFDNFSNSTVSSSGVTAPSHGGVAAPMTPTTFNRGQSLLGAAIRESNPSTPLSAGSSRIAVKKNYLTPTVTVQPKTKLSEGYTSPKTDRNTRSTTSLSSSLAAFPNRFNAFSNLSTHKGSVYYGAEKPKSNLASVVEVPQEPGVTLETIVGTYLRHHHMSCKYPILACPKFSLLKPHHCPDPKYRGRAPMGTMSRLFKRQVDQPYGGYEGAKFDRKYIYSRFRPVKTYKELDMTSCTFTADEKNLVVGVEGGNLRYINLKTTEVSDSIQCHDLAITHCEASWDGKLILTSTEHLSMDGKNPSAVWRVDNFNEALHQFDDYYIEFGKQTQDRIIGTREWNAKIYDVNTGQRISSFYNSDSNKYTKNRATFSPLDDMVLNDGILWDAVSQKQIHKFVKFNPNISGVFHPDGTQIIINSQVWDMRNFRVLHTVEALDQCDIKFNKTGKIIYAAHKSDEDNILDPEREKWPSSCSFKTFDSLDYSIIATIEAKGSILDFCVDSTDFYLATIEGCRRDDAFETAVCRVYEVGKTKLSDEDQMDDNPEDDDDEDEDDGDDDDDDDDINMDYNDSMSDDDLGAFLHVPNSDNSSEFDNSYMNEDDDDDDDDDDVDDDDDDDDVDDDDMDNFRFELSDVSNL